MHYKQAVAELLGELGADASLLVQRPAWHYADPLLPEGATSLPLADALARCYDLRQPKPELLALLLAKLQAAASSNSGANGSAQNGSAHNGSATTNGKQGGGGGKKKRKGGSAAANGKAPAADGNSHEANGGAAVAAAAAHEHLCAQGCMVDKLEVGGWRQTGGCGALSWQCLRSPSSRSFLHHACRSLPYSPH